MPAKIKEPMTILVADDHGMFRESMRHWLASADAGFRVETAATLEEARQFLRKNPAIRLLMLDLRMPGMNGAESIRDILGEWANLRILVISASDDVALIRHCIRLGASGFAPKSLEGAALLEAINIVLGGHIYLPAGVRLADSGDGFTERQMDILRLLAEGESNRVIGKRLHLAESTVKQYVSDILEHLGVENRVKAALHARRILGLG